MREPARGSNDRGARRRGSVDGRSGHLPDILYHATSQRRLDQLLASGDQLRVYGGRPVFFSRHEGQAWQVAHRQGNDPVVLYIDVPRARRARCRFERNAQGLWQTDSVPLKNVLNLQHGFAIQMSAGGLPLYNGPDGPRLALIRVSRRSGTTWEIAKGKLEPGETPLGAACREIREEMGCPLELSLERPLGSVRYGFTTPAGHPRLKILHVYLLQTPQRRTDFAPAAGEGIEEVAWFTPREASRAVTHRSLRPLMRRVRWLLERGESAE